MHAPAKATLILANGHPLFIKGLITVLQEQYSILGIAVNRKELLDLLKYQQPTAVLSDLQMPDMDGFNALKQMVVRYPNVKLIVLSAFYNRETEEQLKQAGIKGYLTKDISSDFLIDEIKKVIAGEVAFCKPEKRSKHHINHATNGSLNQHQLSLRELEVVSLIKKGLTSNEIAKNLFISINTVEAHRKHIYKKLNLKNIQGMVEFAHRYSL